MTAGAALAALLVATLDPNEAGHYPTCPFLALTGMYCPGCGGLRAVHALVHGEVGTALERNPLVVGVAVLVGLVWFGWLLRLLGVRQSWAVPGRGSGSPVAVWSALALVLVFAVVRNLPGWTWLSPA